MARRAANELSQGNFRDLTNNWHLFRDKVVLFLGAGASDGAVNKSGRPLPGGYELRNKIWETLKLEHNETLKPATLGLMSLEHATAIIEAKTGREAISDYLVDEFECEKPLWQHLVLQHLNPRSIVTTNYDELVELGYAASGKLVDVICDDRRPRGGHVPLYKPHGSLMLAREPLGKGRLVITQFDYFEMIAEYRKMLSDAMEDFGAACVITIGYSFGDMDIGAELYSIRKRNGGVPWYAVFPRDDMHVRKMYSRHLGIEQIPMTFEKFLKSLDDAVNFIPREHKHSRIAALRAAGVIG